MLGVRRSVGTARLHRKRARGFVLFIALAAMALQAFVVQTHVHAFAPAALQAQVQHGRGVQGEPAKITSHVAADQKTGCIVCQALATGGALAANASVVAHASASSLAAAIEIRRGPRALTHSWQSRAPPLAL